MICPLVRCRLSHIFIKLFKQQSNVYILIINSFANNNYLEVYFEFFFTVPGLPQTKYICVWFFLWSPRHRDSVHFEPWWDVVTDRMVCVEKVTSALPFPPQSSLVQEPPNLWNHVSLLHLSSNTGFSFQRWTFGRSSWKVTRHQTPPTYCMLYVLAPTTHLLHVVFSYIT